MATGGSGGSGTGRFLGAPAGSAGRCAVGGALALGGAPRGAGILVRRFTCGFSTGFGAACGDVFGDAACFDVVPIDGRAFGNGFVLILSSLSLAYAAAERVDADCVDGGGCVDGSCWFHISSRSIGSLSDEFDGCAAVCGVAAGNADVFGVAVGCAAVGGVAAAGGAALLSASAGSCKAFCDCATRSKLNSFALANSMSCMDRAEMISLISLHMFERSLK